MSALKDLCVHIYGHMEFWSMECEPELLDGASGMALSFIAEVMRGWCL